MFDLLIISLAAKNYGLFFMIERCECQQLNQTEIILRINTLVAGANEISEIYSVPNNVYDHNYQIIIQLSDVKTIAE